MKEPLIFISYNLRIIQEYFQPKIGRKIGIFSLGRKNNILIKKSVNLTVAGDVNETAPHSFNLKLKLIRSGRKLIETPKGASVFQIKPQKYWS